MKKARLWILLPLVLAFGCRTVAPEPAAVGTEAATTVAIKNARMPSENLLTGGQPTAEQLHPVDADQIRLILESIVDRPHQKE